MMLNLLAGLGVWTVVSVGLGLVFGLVTHGYAVDELPARAPLADTGTTPPYRQAA
jgi:hypothetical protein